MLIFLYLTKSRTLCFIVSIHKKCHLTGSNFVQHLYLRSKNQQSNLSLFCTDKEKSELVAPDSRPLRVKSIYYSHTQKKMFKHEKKKQKNIQIQYLSVSDLWINTLMMGEDGIMVAFFPGGPL